ncbi:MAG: glycosyltransferase family 4 protein [Sutterellaceae bacterium]|nr:glycosyltransferase family 4 protein [Burkholderiaceae bacterium]MDW8429335.1 glycosyltransferase family 4 protein [Sutterellaceae bacterium]
MKLRVVLVGPLPPPAGGMANQTRQLARLLKESGVTVQLVQNNAPYRPAWIAHVRGLRAMFRLVPYLVALWRALRAADVAHVMANSGWAWHLFAAPAIWLARLRGVPVLVNYRGGEAEAFLQRQGRWVRPTLRLAHVLAVPSGFLRAIFVRYGIAAEIVPNIVDLTRFTPGGPRAPGQHIVVTRNLEQIYDLPTALRAFAKVRGRYPAARLTIAGSGPELAALQRLAHDLGIADAVRFTGRLDNEQVAALYREADLLLNPSTVDNMPISLLEAMASGVPIVSTNVGGVPYLVEHERTALLVPARDADAMAAAVLRMFDDAGLRDRIVGAALQACRAYAWERVQPQLFAAYARCAGRPVWRESAL